LLLFGTFGDEGEWEVASGQSIKVACRRRILKSIRERAGRTLTPDAQPKKVKQVRIRESRKKDGDRSKHQEGHLKGRSREANKSRNLLTVSRPDDVGV
jgi:hypothetical protein